MKTQNVSIKIASLESTGRWGTDPKSRLGCFIAEQRSYLLELCQVWNLQLSESDEAEEICNILCAMSKNDWDESVLVWLRQKSVDRCSGAYLREAMAGGDEIVFQTLNAPLTPA